MNHSRFLLVSLVVAILILLAGGAPGALEKNGPHGGSVYQEGRNQYELLIEPKNGLVTVYALKSWEVLPRSMSLRLFSDTFGQQTIELHATTPPYEPYPKYQGSTSAGLSPLNESSIAAELAFGVDSAPRLLKRLS